MNSLAREQLDFRILQAQVTKYGIGSKPARLALGRIDRLVTRMPELRGEPVIAGEQKDYWLEDRRIEDQIRENFPDALAPLPVYDSQRPCAKCGKVGASTSWSDDRLQRTCKRCAFSWAELPLDSGPSIEKAPDSPGEG